MNPIFRDLLGMAPGLIAGLRDPQAGAALMAGWERARKEHEARTRQQQQDTLAGEDRQWRIDQQKAEDARAAEDQTWQNTQRNLGVAQSLNQAGATADSLQGAESAIDTLFRVLPPHMQEQMAPVRDASIRGAGAQVTSRQRAELRRWVTDTLQNSKLIQGAEDADPEVTQAMPPRIRQIAEALTGQTAFKKSDVFRVAELLEQAEKKSTANPTPASLAYEAAGGDPSRALELLRPPKAESGESKEPLMAIMGDDGQPVYVPRSQAVGKRPASSREQGRAVTSGDAADIAEFNTALDDVATLRDTLKGNKATGTSAAIGAALPNAITEVTGWGTDAKQKNAVIARVKQVIGKALEGGVLRKEDEAKYSKILPTISDTPEVVATKLDGLERAIRQRQQNKLDALADAGYDISRFASRKPAASPAAPAPATPAQTSGPRVGERRSFNGTLAEWDGKGWKKVAP